MKRCLLVAILVTLIPTVGLSSYRIFVVFSYHRDMDWHRKQLRGFLDALMGIKCEVETFYMDTRYSTSEEYVRRRAEEALSRVESFGPDLLVAFDDNAIRYVLAEVAKENIPCLFAGLNEDPITYGLKEGGNVAGLLERYPFVDILRVVKVTFPWVKRIAVFADDTPSALREVARFLSERETVEGELKIEVVDVFYSKKLSAWLRELRRIQGKADAIFVLGALSLVSADGRRLPQKEAISLICRSSSILEVGITSGAVRDGFAVGVVADPYMHGFRLGKIATGVLTGNVDPAKVGFRVPRDFLFVVNIRRLKQLGVKVPMGLLTTAVVCGGEAH